MVLSEPMAMERQNFGPLLTSGFIAGSLGLLPAIAATFDLVFIGRLGLAPLAGATLVLPLLLLMQTLSLGALGGGILSAVARTGGRTGEAEGRSALALVQAHALKIAVAGGLLFALLALAYLAFLAKDAAILPPVRRAMLLYGGTLMAGAPFLWLVNGLISIERGQGAVRFAALAVGLGALAQIAISRTLTLGLGPWPGIGIEGAALAYLAGNLIAAAISLSFGSGRAAALALCRAWARWSRQAAADVLAIGFWSLAVSLLALATLFILNQALLRYGAAMVGAYGICMRYEFLLIPFLYGFTIAFSAPAAQALGLGRVREARRLALLGTAAAIGIGTASALVLSLHPEIWTDAFALAPPVRAEADRYLRIVAPAHILLAAGLAAYYFGQALGQLRRALLGSLCRTILIALAAPLAVAARLPVQDLYLAVAASFALFGLISATLLSPRAGLWREERDQPSALDPRRDVTSPIRTGMASRTSGN